LYSVYFFFIVTVKILISHGFFAGRIITVTLATTTNIRSPELEKNINCIKQPALKIPGSAGSMGLS
jgi:hypothetical protein